MPTVIYFYCYSSGMCRAEEWIMNGARWAYEYPDNCNAIFGPVVAKWVVRLKQKHVP